MTVCPRPADRFDPHQFTTKKGECGIDGAAILLLESPIASSLEAESRFENKRRDVPVEYIFIQTKSGEDYSRNSMLNFGSAVKDMLDSRRIPQDEWLGDIGAIHDVVVMNAGKISGGLPSLYMYYAADGKWSKRSSDDVLRGTIENIRSDIDELGLFDTVVFEVLDFDALRALWMATKNPVEATFRANEILPIPPIDGVAQAYLAIVSASEFVDKVLAGDDGRIRHSIFEQNVRHFLGSENETNAKMVRTLEDERARGRFAILNNGITLIAPDLRSIGNKQVTVKNFQIVNGCQTSHVLYGQRKNLDDSVSVAVKVIQVTEPDVVDAVVEATNSQSEVPPTQLYAIKNHVRELQDYFDARRKNSDEELYFERRVRQYAGMGISNTRILDIHLLGKSFAAMFLDQPHLASAYAGQLFDELKDELFNGRHPPVAYYAAAMAHYRLFLMFNSGDLVDRSYGSCKWHLMMMMRYRLGGAYELNWENGAEVEKYCGRILKGLESTRSAAVVVRDLIQLLPESKSAVTRKNARTQSFTADARDAVIHSLRKKKGK